MKHLQNRVVMITGASSGIGKACAFAFADEGCDLVLCARRREELEEVAEEVRGKGRRALVVPTDVSSESQVRTLAKKAFRAFGRIDIAVCNAGIGWTGPTHLMRRKDWDRVLGVNLYGVIHVLQQFVPPMVARREGHVVIMSSAFGQTGLPFGALYSVSKAGLLSLGECLRAELANVGVGVTTLCPGLIQSELIANTRLEHVDEEARSLSSMVKPMAVDKFAKRVVRSVKKDRGVVVITGLARLLWYSKRISQRLFEFVALQVSRRSFKYVRM